MDSRSIALALVDDLNAALSGVGDEALPYASLDPDVELEVIGKTGISGVYRGIGQVRAILASTLRRRMASLSVEIVDSFADADTVALTTVWTGDTRAGVPINPRGAVSGAMLVVRGGRVAGITVFPDTHAIARLLFGPVEVSA